MVKVSSLKLKNQMFIPNFKKGGKVLHWNADKTNRRLSTGLGNGEKS